MSIEESVLGTESINLLIAQVVDYALCVRISCLNDCRSVLRGLIGDTLLPAFERATTVRNLRLKPVEALKRSHICGVEALQNACAQAVNHTGSVVLLITNRAVQVREAEIDGVIERANARLQIAEVHILAQIATSKCAAQHTSTSVAEAKAVAEATPAEYEQDNNPKMLPYELFISYIYYLLIHSSSAYLFNC